MWLYYVCNINKLIQNGTSTIKFLNGEVSEITSTNSSSHKYAYDGNNNPGKNVLGMDKIAFVDGKGNGIFDTEDGKVISTYTY